MQQYVENPGKSPMYVGNTMIPPGEGKLVDVPKRAPIAPPAEPKGPNLVELTTELLAKSVAAIVLELAQLTNEALDLAESLEAGEGGKKRKTLIEAIQAERIARANVKLQEEQQQQAEKALHDARNDLLAARLELETLPADAPADARAAAEAAVDEAQAKVDALEPDEV